MQGTITQEYARKTLAIFVSRHLGYALEGSLEQSDLTLNLKLGNKCEFFRRKSSNTNYGKLIKVLLAIRTSQLTNYLQYVIDRRYF